MLYLAVYRLGDSGLSLLNLVDVYFVALAECTWLKAPSLCELYRALSVAYDLKMLNQRM